MVWASFVRLPKKENSSKLFQTDFKCMGQLKSSSVGALIPCYLPPSKHYNIVY